MVKYAWEFKKTVRVTRSCLILINCISEEQSKIVVSLGVEYPSKESSQG